MPVLEYVPAVNFTHLVKFTIGDTVERAKSVEMDAIFGEISRGLRFNRAKEQPLMALFRGQKARTAQAINLLDAIVPTSKKTNKRKPHDEVEDEDEDNGEDNEEEEVLDEVHVDNSKENKDKKKKKLKKIKQQQTEELNAFRNRLKIKVKGDDVPELKATFEALLESIRNAEFGSTLLDSIEQSYWKEPTPIQMQSIPCLMNGRDVLGCSATGSGKTAAFLIPVLAKLVHSKAINGIRGLVIVPTKELGEQIQREAVRLQGGKSLIKSCIPKKSQTSTVIETNDKKYFNKYDLLISTPMRLVSLLRAGVVDLSHVEIIILDEVDKLFELCESRRKDNEGEEEDDGAITFNSSFLSQVDEIFSKCPKKSDGVSLCTGLFSATIGPLVQDLASNILTNPVHITIGVLNAGATTIEQKFVFVGREEGKLLAIRQLVQAGLKPPVLLFLQSKERAKQLFKELVYDGINVDIMHAERSETQRAEVIRRFRTGEIWILICTDLMARGVDFKGVQMVINYDLPQSPVAYIHRIGRTGRAGNAGTAITMFTEDDIPRLRSVANVVKLSGGDVPQWMLDIKPLNHHEKKRIKLSQPRRKKIGKK